MSNNFDAVILGSGIGGLTCGAFLARAGMKVLVLEKHYQIGGYAHSFKRKKYRFESAIHSVAMGNDGMIMHLLRLLGVDKMVNPISHNSMFRTISPMGTFEMPLERTSIVESLTAAFPHEKNSIVNLFEDMQRFYDTLLKPILTYETNYTDANSEFIAKYYNVSYSDYIGRFISDPALKNIFFSQWPFVGSSPSYAPVMFNVLMFMVHMLEGSHYLDGGFNKLADVLASVITSNGGEIQTKREIVKIQGDKESAKVVILDNGDAIEAKTFISNITPYNLHTKILDETIRNKIWIRRLNTLEPALSAVAVYLGLKEKLPSGYDGATMWYSNNDYESVFDRVKTRRSVEPDHLVLLKAPEACDENTMMIMTFAQKDHSDNWKVEKKDFADAILKKAYTIIPELESSVDFVEIGSPATFERYTENTNGSLYGFENTKIIYKEAKLPSRTHLANLYQVGHWGKPGGGVWNVMENGYSCARSILLNQ